MAENDQEQKTEQPTGKHLQDATERGEFAKAPELQVLAALVTALGILAFIEREAIDRVSEYAVGVFSGFATMSIRLESAPSQFVNLVMVIAPIVLPLLLGCAGAAMLVGGFQSGFNLTPKVLGLHFDKLDPAAGFRRVFSASAFPRVGIDVLKILAIGATLFMGARKLMLDPLFSAPVEAAYLGQFLHEAATTFFGRLTFALGIVAAISFGYEKFKMTRSLKMTREEVKDEHRNAEGDTHVKMAMRRLARRLLQKQMLEAVPVADVVVTNPTHFAVALKYERGKDKAPVVLAKGEGRFAVRIKAIAADHGVPMVENKPVARVLYSMGRVGEAIPPELYQAVAEILAVVYRTHRYYFYRLRARRLETAA
jgi:flagellar biosynthetic protein FlhB